MSSASNHALDVSFVVPQVHRLRVTQDVAGDDISCLTQLIYDRADTQSKVLLVAESAIDDASDRVARIDQQLVNDPSIERVGECLLVEGGESIKQDMSCVESVLEHVNRFDLDRRSYIIAIGGGAMLDAVGYAAAIAHRGIRLIRLPTTTLAQADSGVGVKNAVNHFGKKNWVGTFAVPWAVINDAALLTTLSDRDFCSGFSEAVKVSLLKDREQFEWLCENARLISERHMQIANQAIHHSCVLHLKHITEGGDPYEMLEARPLDFGHWSAHKLEAMTGYEIRHGEAVAIGVAIDCFYSANRFGLSDDDALRVCRCLRDLGLPLWHPSLADTDSLLGGLEEFRQHLGGRLTITMLDGVGSMRNVHEIDASLMRDAIGRLESTAIDFGQSQPRPV